MDARSVSAIATETTHNVSFSRDDSYSEWLAQWNPNCVISF